MKAHGLLTAARACALATLAIGLFATPSHAQLAALGATTEVVQMFVRGVDAAYDPRTNNYLMVGAAGRVVGVCVGADGKPVGPAFGIASTGGSFPRAAYSPDLNGGAGGFLVIWSGEIERVTVQLHARVVSCAGATGADQIISGAATSWIDVGSSALAYSSTSKQFLAVWKTMPPAVVLARLVDLSGTGVGDPVQISTGFGRDPGVAWNPNNNEFGVSFSGETGSGVYSAFVRVPATNPAAFGRTTFNVLPNPMLTTATDLTFNPSTNRYLMSWFEISSGSYAKVAEFDAAGNIASQNIASARVGSYDALSMQFNPVSNTGLLVGVDRANDAVLGSELNTNGVRMSQAAEPTISTTAPPARYTRVTSSTTTATWNANWSRGFGAIAAQIVGTGGATGGGGTPPPPPPAASAPRMNTDMPRNGATVTTEGFAIGGWALDAGSPTATGVDLIQVWAYPAGGGPPRFVGTATYGISRPDVGAAFGNPRFNNTGFAMTGVIDSGGAYDLTVFAHSTVTGTYNNVQQFRINVTGPVSLPRMWVDFPTQNLTLSQNITVAGWAIDAGASIGTGVDAVHVYGYPVAGGEPILVGVGAYGWGRADVGAAFGNPRFAPCGFSVQGTLPPGEYNLVVFAHSTVTKTFNNVQVIRLRVV